MRGRLRSALGLAARWPVMLASRPDAAGLRVYYGRPLPRPGEYASGGLVKFQQLQSALPGSPRAFNLLYLGSNTLPRDWRALLGLVRHRGVPLVWNQDGVGYPGWRGPGWERVNVPMQAGLRQAGHVLYQSEFCRVAADRFVAEPAGAWEVLHNPVDTTRFQPGSRPSRPLTLLLGGNQYQRYRLEVALETIARLDDVRLVVTGRLSWAVDAEREGRRLARELGVLDRVEFAGPYAQRDAPAVLRRGDVLLHTKYNDPCPGIVLEAMATGLPIVYSASGGTPELVGPDAGVGVEAPLDWEHDYPPSPDALARAVEAATPRLDELGVAARERAVARFALEPWLERHRQVFEELVR